MSATLQSHMAALPRISIIAACRNEAKHIETFVESLVSQDLTGFDWQVIIADGASNDGTREFLDRYSKKNPRLVVIDNPRKIVSAGLNAAVALCTGEIVLRMDAHTEYARDYVKKCVETLETSGAQNVGGPARTKAEGTWPRAIQVAYHSPFSTGGARFHKDNYTGYVDTVTYGCWRKETMLRLGLFDENLVRNQDDEFNLRLTRAGGKIWQSSEIVSWYRPRTTLSALFKQYFQYGFWKVPVIRKHKIPGSWRHLIPGLFVAGNLVLLLAALFTSAFGHWRLADTTFLCWLIVFGSYLSASLTASIVASKNDSKLFIYLPVTFAVFHVSYGLGFLLGSLYWTLAGSSDSRLGNLFVGASR